IFSSRRVGRVVDAIASARNIRNRQRVTVRRHRDEAGDRVCARIKGVVCAAIGEIVLRNAKVIEGEVHGVAQQCNNAGGDRTAWADCSLVRATQLAKTAKLLLWNDRSQNGGAVLYRLSR